MEVSNPLLPTKTNKTSSELFKAISDVEISGMNKSVAEIRKLQGMPISSLVIKTENGVDKTECHKFIKLVIVWMCQFFGVSWNDLQIKESSKQLYENYYYWTEYDWRHFMNRCISGYFGKQYGAFSPQILMEFASIHNQEWMDESEGQSFHEADQIKKLDEKDRDLMKEIETKTEERIHNSAIEEFKKNVNKSI